MEDCCEAQDSLIHLPCPQAYIEAFKSKPRSSSEKRETKTNTKQGTTMCLQLQQSHSTGSNHCDECIVNVDKTDGETDEFCHIRVKDKDNVVHLTNLNASRWNEDKVRKVLLQINPYWNEKKISIYIKRNRGLLTASIEFKSREYSEKALELIESNFNLFVNKSNCSAVLSVYLEWHKPIHYVTGIKLKFIKANINTNCVSCCYAQSIIPLKFDIKSIISNHYHLHCDVRSKLEYYQNTTLFANIPTTNDILKYLNKCKYPPILSTPSDKLILTIYFPFITLCITHETETYYFYISGDLLSLYQLKQTKYVPIVTRNISPSSLSSLLYIDVLSLLDNTGFYTFYDDLNHNFEIDLYKAVAVAIASHDSDRESSDLNLNAMHLSTMKLPNGVSQLDRCVICLNMIDPYEFTRISSCKHLFHYDCIMSLLQFNNTQKQMWDDELNSYILCNYAHCPLCRRAFTVIQSRICNKNNRTPTVQYINVTDIHLYDDHESAQASDDD